MKKSDDLPDAEDVAREYLDGSPCAQLVHDCVLASLQRRDAAWKRLIAARLHEQMVDILEEQP